MQPSENTDTGEVRRICLPRTPVNRWSLAHRLMRWSSPGVAQRFRPRPLATRKLVPEYRLLPLAEYVGARYPGGRVGPPLLLLPQLRTVHIPYSRIRFLSLVLSTNLRNGSLLPLVMLSSIRRGSRAAGPTPECASASGVAGA